MAGRRLIDLRETADSLGEPMLPLHFAMSEWLKMMIRNAGSNCNMKARCRSCRIPVLGRLCHHLILFFTNNQNTIGLQNRYINGLGFGVSKEF